MTMAADKQDKVLNVPNKRVQNQTCLNSAERVGLRTKGNVPNLRFPEFSGRWNCYRLGDLTDLFSVRNKDGRNYPMYSVTNDMGFVPQSEKFEDRAMIGENINSYKIIREGDFAYNPARINVGSIARYQEKYPCMISSLYVCFKPDKQLVNSDLLLHILKSPRLIDKYKLHGEGGVRIYLFYPNFAQIKIWIPRLTEQSKIAKLLTLIEERITTQIRIIEDLKSLSDVICERLYTPSEKESWKTYKYADLFSISNERNSKLQYTNVLSASQEYGMIERNELNIDIKFEASSITNYKIVRPNQYVIHLRSFQGGFAYSEKTGVCSPAYTILVPNEKLSTAFLKYYFTSKKFIDTLRIVTYGIRDGRSISVEEFLQLKVAIPDIARQQHIAYVMQLWEEKIKTEESYLSKLQQQKQYLLSTMFV